VVPEVNVVTKEQQEEARKEEASEIDPSFGIKNETQGFSRHHMVEAGLTI
jgi:hypothetical protein